MTFIQSPGCRMAEEIHTSTEKKMATHHLPLVVLSCALFLVIGSTIADDDCGLTVYWGQNAEEGSLRDTCDTGLYKIVNMAFLVITGPTPDKAILNLAGHCDPSNGGCASLGEEIQHCQSKGIKVLLSLSGGVGNDESSNADDMVNYLVGTFLKPSESNEAPFGGAALDGFDLAVTQGPMLYNYDLAWGLKETHKGFLALSPPCTPNNQQMDVVMRAGVCNHINVGFFNDPTCDISSGIDGVVASWNRWSISTSPVCKLIMSLPASPEAASTGYMEPELLNYEILPRIRYSDRYGGVALYNRYYDIQNNYSPQVVAPVCDYRGASLKRGSIISQVV